MTDERWWSFVQRLREHGLAKITGDVVIDNTYFAPIDRQSRRLRCATVSQLQRAARCADGELPDLALHRDPVGQRARPQIVVNPLPCQPGAEESRSGSAPAAAMPPTAASSSTRPIARTRTALVVRGVFPVSCGSLFDHARHHDRTRLCIRHVPHVVDAIGRRDRRRARHRATAARMRELLFEYDSLPLTEIIRLVNKFSNNVMARHLLLTLGAEEFGPPATADRGRNAMRAWLAKRGIHAEWLRARERLGPVAQRARHRARSGRDARRRVAQPVHAGVRSIAAAIRDRRHAAQSLQLARHARTHSLEDRRIDDVSALAGFRQRRFR